MIGQRINSALAAAEMTQKELATHIGINNANTISYFCSGARKPNLDTLVEISKALKVSTDYLLGLDDCSSIDPDVQVTSKTTGLTAESIRMLKCMPGNDEDERLYLDDIDVINELFSSVEFWRVVSDIGAMKRALDGAAWWNGTPIKSANKNAVERWRDAKLSYLDVTESFAAMIDKLYHYHAVVDKLLQGFTIPVTENMVHKKGGVE